MAKQRDKERGISFSTSDEKLSIDILPPLIDAPISGGFPRSLLRIPASTRQVMFSGFPFNTADFVSTGVFCKPVLDEYSYGGAFPVN
jgi:hypothetical protein